MSKNKKVWIPALVAIAAALVLVVYYYYTKFSHPGGQPHPRPQGEGQGRLHEGAQRPPRGEDEGYGGYFSTLGTIALYVGAAGFSWFWFKKKLKSPSPLVRKAGRLLHAVHKLMGWFTLLLVAVHGTYYLFTKLHDDNIFSGLASFAILLTLVGYGYFINKVRNKWMRAVHRTLGILWVPVLLLHAGGSAIIAVLASLAVGGLVWFFERSAGPNKQPITGDR
ncbi:hypothetical protein [Paenibacillus sp. R14(2021)]|uniref:hypothetical protein n=1 Tax=Paenibacillus sp. R14(2021) TaxID=2859228 RepID=UPI001C6162DE|nr:hypothetical protein [Paenibacillus sp. R14(2021)]